MVNSGIGEWGRPPPSDQLRTVTPPLVATPPSRSRSVRTKIAERDLPAIGISGSFLPLKKRKSLRNFFAFANAFLLCFAIDLKAEDESRIDSILLLCDERQRTLIVVVISVRAVCVVIVIVKR